MTKRIRYISFIIVLTMLFQQTVWATPTDAVYADSKVVSNVVTDCNGTAEDDAATEKDDIRKIEVPHHKLESMTPEELAEEYDLSIDDIKNGKVQFVMVPDEFDEEASIQTYYSAWGTDEMAKQADAEAQRLVKTLTNDSMSDIQKLMKFSEYLNLTVEYGGYDDQQWYGQTAYEALILKRAVCAGKTGALNMLCYYAGINVNMLRSSQACHAWNQVELNGNWYNLDATNLHTSYTFLSTNANMFSFMSDTETREDRINNRYTYDGKVKSATDSRFEGISFWSYNSSTKKNYCDWNKYKTNAASKGVNTDYFASSTPRGIQIKEKTPSKSWCQNMTPEKSDFSVQSYYLTGNGSAPLTKSSYSDVASKSYDISLVDSNGNEKSSQKLAAGTNRVKASYTTAGRNLVAYCNITAAEDALVSSNLKSIEAEYIGETTEAGTLITTSDFTVTPKFHNTYYSGAVADVDGDKVQPNSINVQKLSLGNNVVTVSYTLDGVTKTTKVTIVGTKPKLKKIKLEDESVLVVDNGSTINNSDLGYATAVLESGATQQLSVVWENYSDKYDPDNPEENEFTVTGRAVLPDYIDADGISLEVSRDIRIKAASEYVSLVSDVESGEYTKSFMVHLTSDDGAKIYYSINGSTEKLYQKAITIKGTVGQTEEFTIEARATKRGFKENSITLSYELTIPDSGDDGLQDLSEYLILVKGEKRSIFEAGCKYQSADPKIAKVDRKGNITAKKAGNTIVYKTTGDEDVTAYEVEVQEPAFASKKTYISAGQCMSLSLINTNEPTSFSIPYNCDCAYISGNGTILTGLCKGKVKVTGYVHGKKYTTFVFVENPKVKQPIINIKAGKKTTVKLTGTKRKPIQVYTEDNGDCFGIFYDTKTGKLTTSKNAEGSMTIHFDIGDGVDYSTTVYVTPVN